MKLASKVSLAVAAAAVSRSGSVSCPGYVKEAALLLGWSGAIARPCSVAGSNSLSSCRRQNWKPHLDAVFLCALRKTDDFLLTSACVTEQHITGKQKES